MFLSCSHLLDDASKVCVEDFGLEPVCSSLLLLPDQITTGCDIKVVGGLLLQLGR